MYMKMNKMKFVGICSHIYLPTAYIHEIWDLAFLLRFTHVLRVKIEFFNVRDWRIEAFLKLDIFGAKLMY